MVTPNQAEVHKHLKKKMGMKPTGRMGDYLNAGGGHGQKERRVDHHKEDGSCRRVFNRPEARGAGGKAVREKFGQGWAGTKKGGPSESLRA